jgi:hypothetical protein
MSNAKLSRVDVARLADDAAALAARLPERPSRIRMRSGPVEIEIEWPAPVPARADAAALPSRDEPSDLAGYRAGRHRRASDDDDGDSRNFSLLTG